MARCLNIEKLPSSYILTLALSLSKDVPNVFPKSYLRYTHKSYLRMFVNISTDLITKIIS